MQSVWIEDEISKWHNYIASSFRTNDGSIYGQFLSLSLSSAQQFPGHHI